MIKRGEWRIALDDGSHPRELMVELTTSCNYSCIYCFRWASNENLNAFMSEATYRKLIKDASDAGVTKLSFSGWGEPLVHPKTVQFIKLATDHGFKVLLNTNGYFLTNHIDKLFELGVDEIVVSLDAPVDSVYKAIRVGGDLRRIIKALMRLKELRKEHGSFKPLLKLQFTINKKNYGQVRNMARIAGELGVSEITISNVIPLTARQEKDLSCYNDPACEPTIDELKREAAIWSIENNVTINLPNFTPSAERVCPFLDSMAAFIRYDGKVAPCIYYAHSWTNTLFGVKREVKEVIFGDINKERLIDIWKKPEYVKFRFSTYFFVMPSCFECPLQEYCTLTLTNESDCWGNTPTCAHCPYSRNLVRCPL